MANESTKEAHEIPNVLLWGGKSTSRIVAEMLIESGIGRPTIIFDNTLDKLHFPTSAQFINDVDLLASRIPTVTHYIVCIGAEHGYARSMTGEYLQRLGLKPMNVIHHKSYVDPTVSMGEGCHIMPCAVIHKFSSIGNHTIINTSATIDHECIIGDGVHIMGSAAITGKVEIGNYATIGTNATILPSVKIGAGALIGAGAVVTRDVEPHSVVAGVPAKYLRKIEAAFFEQPLIKLTSKLA